MLGSERTGRESDGSERNGLVKQVVADSGLTQEGSPDIALIEGPYLWTRDINGTKTQKVIMPCVANVLVYPHSAIHAAMKN
jgi:hypothetical protein